jgi:prepilin-type N-terminal cleavage/methylation domain-containing protein
MRGVDIMKRINNYSKRGFTLVETMCTVAIAVLLISVTSLGISDHIANTKRTAVIVQRSRSTLDEIDQEVYGGSNLSNVNHASYNGVADASSGNSGSSTGSGAGAASNVRSDDVKPAVEEAEEKSAEEQRRDAINSLSTEISDFAETHGVTFLPGTENLPNIIATAEISARELYDEKGFTDPRYFIYNPATGTIKLSRNEGKNMECTNGQNVIKASLNEDAAANTPGCNVRSLMDSSFLNNKNSNIYIGVYKQDDGTYQIVPNLCIDVNGNFNSVITFNFGNGTSNVNRSTYNSNNPPKNWDGYVTFVTTAGGEMLDLSDADLSGYTTRCSTKAQNAEWTAFVQAKRV